MLQLLDVTSTEMCLVVGMNDELQTRKCWFATTDMWQFTTMDTAESLDYTK